MKVYHGWEDIKDKHTNIVVGLGNFDGVHLGHRHLIENLKAKAEEINGISLVFTFYPHPVSVLNPQKAPPMLLSREAKRKALESMGVDVMVEVPFTMEFAQMTPEDFVNRVLSEGLGVKWVVVGYNYTFGYKGRGTPELLQDLGREHGFNVHIIPPVLVEGKPVSSTVIREMMENGEVSRAARYLGYYPCIEGDVVLGERRGKELGFPTANLEINTKIMVPANGVYSVKTEVDGDIFIGVANVGVKPTFQGEYGKRNIEVHLLDFYNELYGKRIKVHFIRRLRGEKRFSSVSELVRQIEQDVLLARTELE